jgi:hypothetical protein
MIDSEILMIYLDLDMVDHSVVDSHFGIETKVSEAAMEGTTDSVDVQLEVEITLVDQI